MAVRSRSRLRRPGLAPVDLLRALAPVALLRALAVTALGAAVLACSSGPVSNLGQGSPSAVPPATASPTASQTATATVAPTPTPVVTPSVAPTASPIPPPTASHTPTPVPIGLCKPSQVSIAILKEGGLYWNGGAGHQMATFRLKNVAGVKCLVRTMSRLRLVNGDGAVLIDSGTPSTSPMPVQTVAPGGTLTTAVQTGNLCAAPPIVDPTRVAFILAPGGTPILATPPVSGGVPPCLGDPSVPSGDIQMQGWAP